MGQSTLITHTFNNNIFMLKNITKQSIECVYALNKVKRHNFK